MILYDAIREQLGDEYTNITYQNMEESKEGALGIYLYESSSDVEDLSGETVYECIKCHIQLNAYNTENGLEQALNYLRHFVEKIETTRRTSNGILFVLNKHIGPKSLCIGKNDYGTLVCVSNIDIKYVIA